MVLSDWGLSRPGPGIATVAYRGRSGNGAPGTDLAFPRADFMGSDQTPNIFDFVLDPNKALCTIVGVPEQVQIILFEP